MGEKRGKRGEKRGEREGKSRKKEEKIEISDQVRVRQNIESIRIRDEGK